ncbi:glycosyltransferase family 2 protein [Paramagnetospirillum magneticum]|uniref:Glycosyltransferase n=1 Tax=Paramagnetospirillum magneticum (strain ATCC 700264 / AMB-1) TaxID=342108 RepID=Q2WB61_PARM1|nr:glycosyltransferase family 2 protein [Paramagnetospirillum magneticum]BAE48914.1 Glycosyltransferase [Paramagnetospirillum magneticum AMB-1]
MLLSVVSPAHNEEQNLPVLHQRLKETLDQAGIQWEWVVVDDHSSDSTFQILTGLADVDSRVRAIRFSRNFGSHKAILCGLQEARGDCAVVMSSDLQDPPEVILSLLEEWRRVGSQVVWAEREARGDTGANLWFAKLYYWLMRRVVDLPNLPPNGADVFLLDRFVVDTLLRFNEQHVSLIALLSWVGFRQSSILYRRGERLHGSSSWSLAKKLKLVIDSVTGFSYLPIRLMSGVGLVTALMGFAYALVVIGARLFGGQPEGWSSLMVVLLVIGGIQMVMMGILGEYLWRALDQSRQRPPFVVEAKKTTPPSSRP